MCREATRTRDIRLAPFEIVKHSAADGSPSKSCPQFWGIDLAEKTQEKIARRRVTLAAGGAPRKYTERQRGTSEYKWRASGCTEPRVSGLNVGGSHLVARTEVDHLLTGIAYRNDEAASSLGRGAGIRGSRPSSGLAHRWDTHSQV